MKGGKVLTHGHPASNRVPSGRPRRCGHQQSPSHLETHACSLGQGCLSGGLELLWPCGHLRMTEGQYELWVCKGDGQGGGPLSPPLFLHHITHLEKGSVGILAKSGFRDNLPSGTQGTGLREKVGTSLRRGSSG